MKPVAPKKQKEEEKKIETKASVPIFEIAVTEAQSSIVEDQEIPVVEEKDQEPVIEPTTEVESTPVEETV